MLGLSSSAKGFPNIRPRAFLHRRHRETPHSPDLWPRCGPARTIPPLTLVDQGLRGAARLLRLQDSEAVKPAGWRASLSRRQHRSASSCLRRSHRHQPPSEAVVHEPYGPANRVPANERSAILRNANVGHRAAQPADVEGAANCAVTDVAP